MTSITTTETQTAIHAWLHRGDQEAASWIVRTHTPAVVRAIRGWLPDADMMDDLVQEVFVKAFQAMHRLAENSQLEAWLSCIARNTCANFLRRWKRRRVFSITESTLDEWFEQVAAPPETSAEETVHREQSIARLLTQLSEQDRRIMWLYHADELSAVEVGAQLGLSPGNVRIRVLRSQRALRGDALQLRLKGSL